MKAKIKKFQNTSNPEMFKSLKFVKNVTCLYRQWQQTNGRYSMSDSKKKD